MPSWLSSAPGAERRAWPTRAWRFAKDISVFVREATTKELHPEHWEVANSGANLAVLETRLSASVDPEFPELRFDRQLQGRAARQGDPGSTCTFVSMEDELAERFLPRLVRRAISTALKRNQSWGRWAARRALKYAQRRAERFAFRQRRGVMAQDRLLAENLLAGQAIDQI